MKQDLSSALPSLLSVMCLTDHAAADGFSVSSEMEVMLGGSPDSGSWTTVGIKKTPTSASQAPSAAPMPAELPKPTASPYRAPRAAGQQRASQQALAAARSRTASMLKAQVTDCHHDSH